MIADPLLKAISRRRPQTGSQIHTRLPDLFPAEIDVSQDRRCSQSAFKFMRHEYISVRTIAYSIQPAADSKPQTSSSRATVSFGT